MPRYLALLVIVLAARTVAADAPSGYRCGAGGYRVKDTCRCPAEKQPARDANNRAICEPKPPPAKTACLADRKGKHFVKIDSSPVGATVYLGAKSCGPVGKTPWTGRLAAGPVGVILEHQSYDSVTQTLTISSRATTQLYVPMQRTMMGAIEIKADADPNIAGLPVLVDGREIGKVPATAKARAGRHRVELHKAGYQTYAHWVEVQDQQTVVLFPTLRAVAVETARLVIDADVAQAEVFVDGVRRGTTPVAIDGLGLGVHTVEVRKPPAAPWKQTVTLAAGSRLLRAELATSIPKAPTDGEVQVHTMPGGAEVLVAGSVVGKTPWKGRLAAGTHWLQVRLDGHVTYETRLAVEAGKLAKLHVRLSPAGTLKIVSTPLGATVYIDNVRRGLTPLELVLPAGEHVVIVERAGYQRFQKHVTIGGKLVEIDARLKR